MELDYQIGDLVFVQYSAIDNFGLVIDHRVIELHGEPTHEFLVCWLDNNDLVWYLATRFPIAQSCQQ